jgi:16S rRNA (cytosine1402-N4)-methyltransferase
MNKEVIELFREAPQYQTGHAAFIDCTLGMGGHTRLILETFENARVIALDVDDKSMETAKKNLLDFTNRVEFHRLDFTRLFDEVDLAGKQTAGILVDPGLSLHQLKDGTRGFSHTQDGPLDMRKDQRDGLTAAHIIASYSEAQLTELFETYGEIKGAAGLAKKIIEARLFGAIDTTHKLAGIVAKYFNWRPKPGKTHPAANVFQALRIAVNHELEGVSQFIADVPKYLPAGARLLFLTFHSVEDRLVKRAFTALKKENKLNIIKPFPAFPSQAEVAENPPSRSVKLRAGEVT